MAAVRIVAFLDVLGFGALVEAIPHHELLGIYGKLQRAARRSTTSPQVPDDHRRFDPDAFYYPDEETRRRVASVFIASDSIIVFSTRDQYDDAAAVTVAVNRLLLAGFRLGVPLRGAITIGELDQVELPDNATASPEFAASFGGLVGRALVRAYRLEGQCEWSGVILAPELVAHLQQVEVPATPFPGLALMGTTMLLVQTEAPFKVPGAKVEQREVWAAAWPLRMLGEEPPLRREEVVASFESFGRTPDERKRSYTLDFLDRAEADRERTIQSQLHHFD